MRFKTGLAVLAALVLVAADAGAEGMRQGLVTGTIGGGLQVPVGDYSDIGKTGFGGGLGLDYAVSRAVTVGGAFQYNRNSISDDLKAILDFFASPYTVEGHYTVLHYGANMKYFFTPESKTRPFFTIGGGLYNFKATLETAGVSASDSETNGGVNGGFGVMFDAGAKTHIGLLGQYNDIFTSGNDAQYVNVLAVFSIDLNTP